MARAGVAVDVEGFGGGVVIDKASTRIIGARGISAFVNGGATFEFVAVIDGVFGKVLLEARDMESEVVAVDPGGGISAVAPFGFSVAFEEAYGKGYARARGDGFCAVWHKVGKGGALVVDRFEGESDVICFAHAVPVAEAPDAVHVAGGGAVVDISVGFFVVFEDLVDGAVFGGVIYSSAVFVEIVM